VRNVYQTTSQITGIGSLQSGIGKTLTCTVGRDKVLKHAQTFLEVRKNRVLDNLCTFSTCFLRLGHQTTHTRELTNLFLRTTGTRIQHHVHGIETLVVRRDGLHEDVRKVVVNVCPCIDNLIVTLVVGDETHVVVHGDLLDFLVTTLNQFFFLLRNDDIVQVERQTSFEGHLITQVLDTIKEFCSTSNTDNLDDVADDVAQRLLRDNGIHESGFNRYDFVNNNTTYRSFTHYLLNLTIHKVIHQHLHRSMNVHLTLVVGNQSLFGAIESETFTLSPLTQLGNIVQTEYHILRRHSDRSTVSGIQNIVRLEHQHLCFQNCFIAQRQVNSHLVTVEVGIERGTCQRVELDSFAFNHLRLECLDTQTVQCRCTVEQYGMTLHYMLKDIEDNRFLAVYNLLGALHSLHDSALNELTDNERLVKFGSHQFRQTTLAHLQFRTHNDY